MTWNQRQIRKWDIETAVMLAFLALAAMGLGGLVALRVAGALP